MADLKISQTTALSAAPADGDLFALVDVSDTTMAASGTNKKLPAVYVARSDGANKLITGSNRELTVPATGTAALLGAANAFTNNQSIAVAASATVNQALDLPGQDNGAGWAPWISIGRNTNGSTPGPGWLRMYQADGGTSELFPDNSGVWRTTEGNTPISSVFPTATVVGAQTSHASFKDIIGAPVDDATALAFICTAAAQVARFIYKSGAYNGEEFSGVVLDGPDLDRYGMDADPDHAAGKALNVINAIGDLFLAVRELNARIQALEAR